MRTRCPHCHNPIELLIDAELTGISCPSCGSSFNLVSGDTTEVPIGESRRLAHFELLRVLGMGQFGSVWKAHDSQLDRTVAIKIPRKGALTAKETEWFLRDARAAAQLRHPHIIGVHEVGREGDTIYIVSDFVDGANWKEWLSGRRLTHREAAEFVLCVAEALHHAHEAGVVHRDLKPSNIMLDFEAEPHIIDFGLAKRDAGEITMTLDGHVLGTPAYMSPEQAAGKGHDADRRSDVYSLGVILYELLTGQLPFKGDTQILLIQIQRDQPPPPRSVDAKIPRDLDTITLKCLEKEPARRYQTAEELAKDLRLWLDGRPITARRAGRLTQMSRWAQRNPLSASLMIAATGLVLLLALVLYRVRPTNAVEYALSADDIKSLETRAYSLEQQYKKIDSLFKIGTKRGEAKEQSLIGRELETVQAVLAWSKGDADGALAHMEKANQFADRAMEATSAAFEAETVTLDQLVHATHARSETQMALSRLKRSISGERTDWIRIALPR